MDFFQIDKNSIFLIYGTGGDGLRIFKTLQKNNIRVAGFIDKRANDIKKLYDKPVWTLENIPQDQDYIVVITLKNVYLHENISKQLTNLGIYKQIYTPISVLDKNENIDLDLQLYQIYQDLLQGVINKNCNIKLSNKKRKIILKDDLFIKKDDEYVTCYMPIELIFNYKVCDNLQDCPMVAFYQLIELFEFFHNKITDAVAIENYIAYSLTWLVKTDMEFSKSLKQSWVESRYEVYKNMLDKFQFQIDYFVEFAPVVEMHSTIHFNLNNSGRNRVAFLIALGYEVIPIKVKKEDYHKFSSLSDSKLQQIEQMENNFFSRLPHPLLYKLNFSATNYSSVFLRYIITNIYKNICDYSQISYNKDYTMLDNKMMLKKLACYNIGIMMHDNGHTSRFFNNTNMNVFTYKSIQLSDIEENSLNIINNIFNVNCLNSKINDNNSFNAIVICNNNSYDENISLIKKCKNDLFILSGDDSVILNEILNYNFIQKSSFYQYYDLNHNTIIKGYHYVKEG